mmetsp:Transcript_49255/g.159657  ORF Transcript_49255/g.159657 Transcript_49255/m.159657 type:complete len:328 (-) Transcript_49255:65-1048(-)
MLRHALLLERCGLPPRHRGLVGRVRAAAACGVRSPLLRVAPPARLPPAGRLVARRRIAARGARRTAHASARGPAARTLRPARLSAGRRIARACQRRRQRALARVAARADEAAVARRGRRLLRLAPVPALHARRVGRRRDPRAVELRRLRPRRLRPALRLDAAFAPRRPLLRRLDLSRPHAPLNPAAAAACGGAAGRRAEQCSSRGRHGRGRQRQHAYEPARVADAPLSRSRQRGRHAGDVPSRGLVRRAALAALAPRRAGRVAVLGVWRHGLSSKDAGPGFQWLAGSVSRSGNVAARRGGVARPRWPRSRWQPRWRWGLGTGWMRTV